MKCCICNAEFVNFNVLSKHITEVHKIDKKDYYDKYLKVDINEGVCKTCGKNTKFINLTKGYRTYCSTRCSTKNADVQYKMKKTCLEKYDVDNPLKSKYFIEKGKNTKLKKYNNANFNNKEKRKKTCLEKYGVENPIQLKEIEETRNRENMCLFGSQNFKDNLLKKYNDEKYRNEEKRKKTCLEKYGVENPFGNKEIQNKIKETVKKKYNVDNYRLSEEYELKRFKTNMTKYGFEWSNQNVDIRNRQKYKYTFDNKSFDSSFEIYYYIWLKEHNINFEYEPKCEMVYEYENKKHYYQPDFLVDGEYVEIKGSHFFENGKLINPFDRSMDGLYNVKYECMLKNDVKIITDCSEYKDYVDKKYTKNFIQLFKNDLPFPYPKNDIIKRYHHSIYHANREGYISPYEAWQDKELIYKSALNRLKYVNSCTPKDIIQGFNVAKIAPKVSVFKPSLAREIIDKYLKEYTVIFDPFSGFSGRMIGACQLGKKYIGQDINEIHIKESKELCKDYNYDALLEVKDVFESYGEYESLFTCSPYNLKEHWNDTDKNLSCDEWIDICLEHFKCKKYVFVVDNTEKYKDKIVETIENKSHLNTNYEYVVVI